MYRSLLNAAVAALLAWLPAQAALGQEPEVIVAYERPDTDYSQYKRFLIKPLDLSDVTLIPPPWVEGRAGKPRPWKISDSNAAFLQEQYILAMKDAIGDKGGYRLTAEPDKDVLAVEIEIVSLTPYARRDETVITKGSGELTLRAEIRDSMTGDLLVLFEGDTKVGEDYQENTEFKLDQNLDELFHSWGVFLRDSLTEAKM